MTWTVYILRCADDTLYTGITINLTSRLSAHAEGRGAKYTRGRGPYDVIFHEAFATHSEALKREAYIKRLSRTKKLDLAMSLQSPCQGIATA